jgi:C4-dicarboxylate-specific signal transduction histidine kinase
LRSLQRSQGNADLLAQRLRIGVADDGAGVPLELVNHIFTPFFTTKKQGARFVISF